MHTEQQIEQWARECIAEDWTDHIPGYYRDMNLTRFAALVAQSERERCAKLCDEYAASVDNAHNRSLGMASDLVDTALGCAAAIRNSDWSKG